MNGRVENQKPLRFVQSVKARTGTKRKKITQERLREVLYYDQETGVFSWMPGKGKKRPAGENAGGLNLSGYITIGVYGTRYFAHRLAWLYVYGYFPEGEVDHINRLRNDNRISNLREASRQCQIRNSSFFSNNTSGIKGVARDMRRKETWLARITVGLVSRHIGCYPSKLEAAYARYAAEQCLGFPNCNKDSSAKKFIDQCSAV